VNIFGSLWEIQERRKIVDREPYGGARTAICQERFESVGSRIVSVWTHRADIESPSVERFRPALA